VVWGYYSKEPWQACAPSASLPHGTNNHGKHRPDRVGSLRLARILELYPSSACQDWSGQFPKHPAVGLAQPVSVYLSVCQLAPTWPASLW
jgi:hypothetical protein